MKTQVLCKKMLAVIALLMMALSSSAQWGGGGGGGNNLPLIAETDFACSGGEGDAAYWQSIDMVDGFGNSLFIPTFSVGRGFTLPKDTKADASKSTFFDNRSYAINPNPIRLDSFRLDDDGADVRNSGAIWGIVFSAGKTQMNNTLALSMTVPGLKANGSYRVEVQYCNPLSVGYLNTSGSAKPPHLNSGYQSQIKIGTNASGMTPDGAQTTALKTGCNTATISNPTQYNNTQGPIGGDGTLKVDVVIAQMAAGEAIMIRSIKIYADLDVKLTADASEVCAGGATASIALANQFQNCKFQWYKDNQAVRGATNSSIIHESGDQAKVSHTYYCEITLPSGSKVKSESFKITDIECCTNENGLPADQKLIWKDDFGTFTSPKNYWVWDYSDISNPKKVNYTNGSGYQRALKNPGETEPEDSKYAGGVDSDGGCNCPPRVAGADNNKFSEGYYTVAAYVTSYGMQGGNNMGWVGYFGDGNEPSKAGYAFAPDHTYGEKHDQGYGAMLYLNIGSQPDAIIYDRTIKGLCDRHITLKCYLNNFSRSNLNPIKVYLRVTDLASGNLKESDVYERFANNTTNRYGTSWVPAQVSIDLTGSELKFEIISKAGGPDQNKDGNDLILDDIEIWACAEPSVDLYFDADGATSKEITTCTGEDAGASGDKKINLMTPLSKMITTNLGDDARFLFQYSKTPDDLKSWKNLSGVSKNTVYEDLPKFIEDQGFVSGDKMYFRTILGYENVLTSKTDFNPHDLCGSYSVSDPILLKIDCPKCEEPTDPKITAKGGKVAATRVDLCDGESTVLSSNSIKGKDDASYDDYSLTWYRRAADGTETAVGTKVGKGTKANDLTVDWADVEAAGTTYVLRVHDNFENEKGTKACDKTAEIVVYANPTPTAPAIDNQEFCENDTRPTIAALTASDFGSYNITWTQPSKAEPNIATFDVGTTTIGYTVTDKTTGCVSPEATFDVTVNRVPTYKVPELPSFCAGQSTEANLPETIADSTIAWSPSNPVLNDLPGQTAKHKFTYTVTHGNCVSDPKEYEINVLPSAKVTLSATPSCEGTNLDVQIEPAGAASVWSGVATAEKKLFKFGVDTEGKLTVTVPETSDYCEHSASVDIELWPTPNNPVPHTITYLKKEVTKDIQHQNPTCPAATMDPDATDPTNAGAKFMWRLKGESAWTDVVPTPTVADVNDPETETVVYEVKLVNDKPCESEVREVEIQLFGAPVPLTHDTTFCLDGASAAFNTFVKEDNSLDATDTYTIRIYEDAALKNELPYDSEPSVSVVGKKAYYATQTGKGGESKPVTFYVSTIGVKEPTVDRSTIIKCNTDAPEVLTATEQKDEANCYMSSGVLWSANGGAYSATEPTTSQVVGEYTYKAKQTYTIPKTTVVCEGKEVEVNVTIDETTAPQDLNPTYVLSDAEVSGSFKNVIEAAGVTLEDGYTYEFSAVQDAISPVPTNFTTSIPAPAVPSKNEVDGNSITKYVYYHRIKQSGGQCTSEPALITITISDSPMPKTPAIYFCEGETIASLDSYVTISTEKKTADKYELRWYGTTKPSSSSEQGSTTVPAAPASTVSDIEKPEVLTYYVAQKDLQTNAIGTASALVITIYPNPILDITHPATVCETAVNIKSAEITGITNKLSGQTYSDTYFSDAAGTSPMTNTSVTESGTYYVQYEYTPAAGHTCKSTIDPIQVQIDTLGWKTQDVTTCPERSATFEVQAESNVSSVIYDWKGVNGNSDANTDKTSSTFQTRAFLGAGYGEKFDYELTITAGTCTETGNFQVELGTGPVVGTIVLENTNNPTDPERIFLNNESDDPTNVYYFCGGDVVVTPKLTRDPDDATNLFELSGPESAKGEGPFTVTKSGTYTLSYENGCPTSVNFTISDAAIDLVGSDPATDYCTGDRFDARVTVTNADPDYGLQWYKNDAEITGAITASYIIESTDSTNTGLYSVKAESHGCKAEVDVVDMVVHAPIVYQLPAVPTVCEGTSTTLEVMGIGPSGTTITWNDNSSITSELDQSSVTIEPIFNTATSGYQSTNYYRFVLEFPGCQPKVDSVAIKVDMPLVGEIEGNAPICEGANIKMDAISYAADTYTWMKIDSTSEVTGAFATMRLTKTTTFLLHMTRGVCEKDTIYRAEVTENPTIERVDSVGIRDRRVIATGGTGSYRYAVDGNDYDVLDTKIGLLFTAHKAYIIDENECADTMPFYMTPPPVIVPNYFSPNGDGMNEQWIPTNLREVYPNALVTIFDRYGKKLAQYRAAEDDWDGTYNGKEMPSTDYWYEIDIEEIDKQYVGHFTLLRR